MYTAITRDIKVSVNPVYLEGQSTPDDRHFVWAYQVKIENQSKATVQLINRYWRITDALGRVQEVRGEGVVGEQPILKPGQSFEYTSGTPLPTPSGIMLGRYEMVGEGGERFEIDVPAFSLDVPSAGKPLLN
ncbi:MAG: Co2+/Mg2+ efflux protein ApaG [Alphaproteobacteria bacterium]|nr:Co2+/Mg2+ efflux protein ApaG [Alphaproteobacteria bacterium]